MSHLVPMSRQVQMPRSPTPCTPGCMPVLHWVHPVTCKALPNALILRPEGGQKTDSPGIAYARRCQQKNQLLGKKTVDEQFHNKFNFLDRLQQPFEWDDDDTMPDNGHTHDDLMHPNIPANLPGVAFARNLQTGA